MVYCDVGVCLFPGDTVVDTGGSAFCSGEQGKVVGGSASVLNIDMKYTCMETFEVIIMYDFVFEC